MESKFDSPHASVEAEIARLSEELGRKPEGAPAERREAIREALRERVYSHGPAPAAGQAPMPSAPAQKSPDSSAVLPRYMDDAPREVKLKVEELVDLAYHKGIMEAVRAAEKAGPLALDAFHDALTDRLYEDLKKRGIIK